MCGKIPSTHLRNFPSATLRSCPTNGSTSISYSSVSAHVVLFPAISAWNLCPRSKRFQPRALKSQMASRSCHNLLLTPLLSNSLHTRSGHLLALPPALGRRREARRTDAGDFRLCRRPVARGHRCRSQADFREQALLVGTGGEGDHRLGDWRFQELWLRQVRR